MLLLSSDLLLVLDKFGVSITEDRWWRWWRLIEPGGDAALLLVDLLHSLKLVVFGDGLEIIGGTVKQSDTNVGGLESSNVVRTVSRHQGGEAEFLEGVENEFLLRRRYTSVNPGVADEVFHRRTVLELLESGTGNTDIEVSEHVLIEGLLGVAGDVFRLVNVTPDELIGGCALLEVQNHDLSVDNFNITSDVNSGKRVVTGDHDTLR